MTRILVVDDEQMMLMLTKRVLSSQYQVICAHSGQEALSLYERERPDLILSDLLMPGMTGFEMYEKLREKYQTEVPIMYMTADDDSELENKGFNLGAADFIRKPFRSEVLLKRVENILENQEKIRGLTQEATTDRLTGFLNKAGSEDTLKNICQYEKGVLLVVDLDSFKLVNDIYGHEMGDRVLTTFADLIRNCTRSEDIKGRLGGDEFVIFCRQVEDEYEIAMITRRINDGLLKKAKEMMGEDMKIPLGASIGAVYVPRYGTDYSELFKMADKALYLVKQNGKHGYSVYETTSNDQASEEDISHEMGRLSQIFEERNVSNAAFWLGQDAFSYVYRFVLRYIKSYHSSAYKLLFTVTPFSAELPEGDLTAIASQFGEILNRTLRKSDIMMQSKVNEFFLLLPETTLENISLVVDRILTQWEKQSCSEKVKISYEMEIISPEYTKVSERRRGLKDDQEW